MASYWSNVLDYGSVRFTLDCSFVEFMIFPFFFPKCVFRTDLPLWNLWKIDVWQSGRLPRKKGDLSRLEPSRRSAVPKQSDLWMILLSYLVHSLLLRELLSRSKLTYSLSISYFMGKFIFSFLKYFFIHLTNFMLSDVKQKKTISTN